MLTVSGADSELLVDGLDSFVIVGRADEGTLNVMDGGRVQIISDDRANMRIARDTTGVGTVVVSGAGSKIGLCSVDCFGAGRIFSFSSFLTVGENGTGELRIENGGEVDPVFMNVGARAGSMGTVIVGTNPVSANPSTLMLSGRGTNQFGTPFGAFLTIGRSGTGSATVLPDGVIEIIGGADPVQDVLPGFQLGRSSVGVGTLIVDGGRVTTSSGLVGPQGAVNQIGRSGNGTMMIMNGGLVLNDLDGNSFVGRRPGSVGQVTATGTGSLWNAGNLLLISKNFDFDTGTPFLPGGTGTVTVTDGGIITANTIELGPGGSLLGNGTVNGNIVNDGGVVDPGLSAGTLSVNGDFSMTGGLLKIEIGGQSSGEFDVLNITGAASITGGTILLSFINGFLPEAGQTVNFLVTNAISAFGGDTSVDFEGVADDFELAIDPTPDGQLRFTALNDASSVIDIKPDNDPNAINPQSKGVIPVAILSTNTFNALGVDPQTVRFGPDEATITHAEDHVEDVDGDGDLDLVVHFETRQTGIVCGDTSAALTAQTVDGASVIGSDKIVTVGCE